MHNTPKTGTAYISGNNSAPHWACLAGAELSVFCPLQFSLCNKSVNVLCFIQRLLSNLFSVLVAVQVALLEIMLKQYCLSERVINHQVDKSSGHCWRVMGVLLTFNTFGLLLVSWIISTLMMVQIVFCAPSILVIMCHYSTEGCNKRQEFRFSFTVRTFVGFHLLRADFEPAAAFFSPHFSFPVKVKDCSFKRKHSL